MKILKVPYAEKDQAKALGARWNSERKTWYVPDGQATEPFEQWLTPACDDKGASPLKAKTRIDATAGDPVKGAWYMELPHECDPFVECAQCAPLLEKSGWKAAHAVSATMIAAVRSPRIV